MRRKFVAFCEVCRAELAEAGRLDIGFRDGEPYAVFDEHRIQGVQVSPSHRRRCYCGRQKTHRDVWRIQEVEEAAAD